MTTKLKVLHIGKYFPPFFGGIENFMADLMEESVAQDIESAAIVHHHEVDLPFSEETIKGSRVYRVPILGKAVFVPLALRFAKYLNQVIEKERPGILHLHLPNVSCFWCLFSRRARKIPWVIHWHADVLGSAPDWRIKVLYPFYRLFEKALLKRAHQVIATSPPYLQSSLPLRKHVEKTTVIPLGLKTTPYPGNSLSQGNESLKLLCIGRLTYYKGHKNLIEAVRVLRDQNVNIELHIVGQGELFSELVSFIEDSGLNHHVKMYGRLSESELNLQIKQTDLLCLASIERTEAFGVVLLEAMREAKPCLVTDVEGSGMSWVVQDGYNGLLAKTNDVSHLTEVLNIAYKDRQMLLEMGANGKQKFESLFDISQVAKEIGRTYKACLN